ncbi:hypothetical protein F210042A8_00280 [Blautia parvula]
MSYNEYAVDPFQQEGGAWMDYIINLIISVMAGIITYFIGKWLDRNKKGS